MHTHLRRCVYTAGMLASQSQQVKKSTRVSVMQCVCTVADTELQHAVTGICAVTVGGAALASWSVAQKAGREFDLMMEEQARVEKAERDANGGKAGAQPVASAASTSAPSQGRRRIKRSGEKPGNSNMPN